MVSAISNMLDLKDPSLRRRKIDINTTKSIVNSIDRYTSNVNLKPGRKITLK